MHIYGTSQVHGPQSVNAPHRAAVQETNPETQTVSNADQLDISQEADLVSRVRELPEIRADRVADIRAAIDEGIYETEEKLDLAVNGLLDEIGH